MNYQAVFCRFETKFILNLSEEEKLKNLMKSYMLNDKYSKSTICNLYYDTPNFLLIRRSLEKPVYKEKLRMRSYGIATSESFVFAEIKKKYNSLVYKRRLSLKEDEARAAFAGKVQFPDTQIGHELDFCLKRYEELEARVFLSYERDAFYGKYNKDFRITFDKNILWRDEDLSLCQSIWGNKILDSEHTLLEVKTPMGIPLWLTKFLSENEIYKQSFSKYGKAFQAISEKKPANL